MSGLCVHNPMAYDLSGRKSMMSINFPCYRLKAVAGGFNLFGACPLSAQLYAAFFSLSYRYIEEAVVSQIDLKKGIRFKAVLNQGLG